MTGNAYRTEATLGPSGKVELNLPLPPGTPVDVIVLVPTADSFSDLVAASGTAIGFWDTSQDDENWNATRPG